MKLEEIFAKMKAVHESMVDLLGKAEKEEDSEKAEAFKISAQSKGDEFTALEKELEAAKTLAAHQTAIAGVEALLKVDADGKNLNPPDAPTKDGDGAGDAKGLTFDRIETPSDAVKEDLSHRVAFLDFCRTGYKNLKDEQMNQLMPGPEAAVRLAKVKVVNPIMLPKSVARMIMLQRKTLGKTMLSTDSTGGATDSGGANLFPATAWQAQLLEEPLYQLNLYDQVQMVPAGNGHATWPKVDTTQGLFGGVAFTWKATEGLDKGTTEPTFGTFTFDTHELSGWTQLSLTMLRRSNVDLEAFIITLFRAAAKYEWAKMILHGSGTNRPLGIVTDATNAAGHVSTLPRQNGNQVDWLDLTGLEYDIKKGFRNGAGYLVEDTVEKYLKQDIDTQGRPIFTADTAGGIRTKLAGFPYQIHDFVTGGNADAPLGTKGDVIFGNLKSYAFGIEEDMAIARSDEAEFKAGLVVFRLICFVGGKPMYAEGLTCLTDAAE